MIQELFINGKVDVIPTVNNLLLLKMKKFMKKSIYYFFMLKRPTARIWIKWNAKYLVPIGYFLIVYNT